MDKMTVLMIIFQVKDTRYAQLILRSGERGFVIVTGSLLSSRGQLLLQFSLRLSHSTLIHRIFYLLFSCFALRIPFQLQLHPLQVLPSLPQKPSLKLARALHKLSSLHLAYFTVSLLELSILVFKSVAYSLVLSITGVKILFA